MFNSNLTKLIEQDGVLQAHALLVWGNVQGVCPRLILALLISVFFAIFHMEAPENTQEFFSIASL